MPRFSVAFTRRKSAADTLDNAAVTGSSFRVLDRSEVAGAKTFDGGVKLATTTTTRGLHRPTRSDATVDDNIFAGLKPNRYVFSMLSACMPLGSRRSCQLVPLAKNSAGVAAPQIPPRLRRPTIRRVTVMLRQPRPLLTREDTRIGAARRGSRPWTSQSLPYRNLRRPGS